MIRTTIIPVVLLMVLTLPSSSQQPYTLQPVMLDTAFVELVQLPGSEKNVMSISAAPHSALVFQRNKENGTYTSILKTSVSFINSKDFSVCGNTFADTVKRTEEFVAHLRSKSDRDVCIAMHSCNEEVTVAKATVEADVATASSKLELQEQISTAVIPVVVDGNIAAPVGKGGAVEFGEQQSLLILTSREMRSVVVEVVNDKEFSILRESIVPRHTLQIGAQHFKLSPKGEQDVVQDIAAVDSFYASVIDLPIGLLEEGAYTVTISQGVESYTHPIHVHWHDKPRTLSNKDMAVQLMELIVPADEFDRIESASSDMQLTKAMNWWALQDPSPGTAFNEAMAAFYTRADYALRTFRSHTKTGVRSDRGKVFMLYGEPTSVKQRLTGDVSQEVWEYANQVDRVFTFTKNGSEYTLASIEPNRR